ncbi:MAG: hypothetical protein N2376_13555 [Clostridia bacterium]|nr:hypothetical protein [Clostridia bacterium]
MKRPVKLLLLMLIFVSVSVLAFFAIGQPKIASRLAFLDSDEPIKASVFVKTVLESAGIKAPQGSTDQWYTDLAIQKGYMRKETFKTMDSGVQRIDGSIFIVHVFEDVYKDQKISLYPELFTYFRDLPDVPIQKRLFGLKACALGIIELHDGILRPHTLLTEKEARAYIERMLYPEKRIVQKGEKTFTVKLEDGMTFHYTDDLVFYQADGEKWDVNGPKTVEFFEKALESTTFKMTDKTHLEVKGKLPATPMGFAWRYSITCSTAQNTENPIVIKTVDKTDEQVLNPLPKHGGEFSYTLEVPETLKPGDIQVKAALVWEHVYSFSYQAEYSLGSDTLAVTSGAEGTKDYPFEGITIQ